MMQFDVRLPVQVRTEDYHYFESLRSFLSRLLGKKVKCKEVEVDRPYVAIFYVGQYPEDVKNLPEIKFE